MWLPNLVAQAYVSKGEGNGGGDGANFEPPYYGDTHTQARLYIMVTPLPWPDHTLWWHPHPGWTVYYGDNSTYWPDYISWQHPVVWPDPRWPTTYGRLSTPTGCKTWPNQVHGLNGKEGREGWAKMWLWWYNYTNGIWDLLWGEAEKKGRRAFWMMMEQQGTFCIMVDGKAKGYELQ